MPYDAEGQEHAAMVVEAILGPISSEPEPVRKISDKPYWRQNKQRRNAARNAPGAVTIVEEKAIKAVGKCHYCGIRGDMELDHVTPLSRGGEHTHENLVACCPTCNRSKANLTVEEWRARKLRGLTPSG